MNKQIKNVTISSAVAIVLAAGNVSATENPFSATALQSGYQVAAAEGTCGGDAKKADGKCGEAKCGAEAAKSHKKADGKCGEGKCGGDAATSDKKAEGKCGGDAKKTSKKADGKCGEGKCGG